MILISQNLVNYDIPIPKNAVFRINLAWVNSIDQLKELLTLHKKHDIFLDLPTNRTKPPNNRYTLNDISSLLDEYRNVKYLAVSNVNSKENLDEYLTNIPKHVTIVPKIESHIGVENIESIVSVLNFEEKIVMLDHDDLFGNLLKSNIPIEKFSHYINQLIDFCKINNILLLRTIGIIFTNENKNVSDYIR